MEATNRIKAVLVEKQLTSKWLADRLRKIREYRIKMVF